MAANKKKHGTVLVTGASSGTRRELALEFGARRRWFWRPGGWTGLSSCASNCWDGIQD
jgi:hypothetical protein